MIVLGVDSAGAACSVALRRDAVTEAVRRRAMARGHAAALVPLILETVADVGLSLAAIDLFGVTVGPGAFTGLRVGLATVSGMALARDRPIVGVGNFDAAALSASLRFPDAERILVVLDSRRPELFAQCFAGVKGSDGVPRAEGAARALAPEALPAMLSGGTAGPLVLAGDAAARTLDVLAAAGIVVAGVADGEADPALVAAIAESRAATASRFPPGPLYMRAPDARPAGRGRGIAAAGPPSPA